MADTNTKSLEAWGRDLLRDFPAGLGDEPDFERDGTARTIWFSQGYKVGVQWASEIGIGGKVFLGEAYEDPDVLDDPGKVAFAKKAFQLGRFYLHMAKSEADKTAEQAANLRSAIAATDKEVEALRNEIGAISSREELHIRIDAAKQASVAAQRLGNAIEDYSISRKITTLQGRLIEIETEESRRASSGFWITAIGTAAGIVGLILGFLAGSGGNP